MSLSEIHMYDCQKKSFFDDYIKNIDLTTFIEGSLKRSRDSGHFEHKNGVVRPFSKEIWTKENRNTHEMEGSRTSKS